MSFHLEGPWLSTTGKRKGKHKFRNADEVRRTRELEESWAVLRDTYSAKPISTKVVGPSKMQKLVIPAGRGTSHIKSLDSNNGVAGKVDAPVYTGTKIKGIGTMHKSNAVPVFSDEEAIEISKMRR